MEKWQLRIESPLEQIFFCTVRMECVTSLGGTSGTGFLYGVFRGETMYPFIITNRHVIENALSGSFWFHAGSRENLDLTSPVHVQLDQLASEAFYHPDPKMDLAAIPLTDTLNKLELLGKEPFGVFLDASIIPDSSKLDELDAVEEVVFVGYPEGLYDAANFLPIVRRGHTATPVQVDYCGQRAYLIDAAVFPGSSGSPVFIIDTGGYNRRGTFVMGNPRLLLLGVISSGHIRKELGEIVWTINPPGHPSISVAQMMNLGIVVKSDAVDELCELCLASHGI